MVLFNKKLSKLLILRVDAIYCIAPFHPIEDYHCEDGNDCTKESLKQVN